MYSLSLEIKYQGALVKELGHLENVHHDYMPPTCNIINDLSFSPFGDIFAGPNLTQLITDICNHLHPFGMQNTTVLLHNNNLGLNLNVLRLIVHCKKLSHRIYICFWYSTSGRRYSISPGLCYGMSDMAEL